MYFHDDWLIKQIENMAKAIAIFICHKNTSIYTGTVDAEVEDTALHQTLQLFLQKRDLCKAEDFLFESISTGNLQHLEIGIDFYRSLNLLTDEELEACNFTREEICDGLKTLAHIYEIDDCLLLVGVQ